MCRTAVSAWNATNWGKSSTAYSAFAVSWTFQTTTAAISIGLPSASFTFATEVSWLRSRTDTFRRRVIGFTNTSPGWRTVPWYRPNSCSTRASPATTGTSPASSTAPITSRMVPHSDSTPPPLPRVMADISSATPTHSATWPGTMSATPRADQALYSTGSVVAGVPVLVGGCMTIACHLQLTYSILHKYHID